jgi:hypothetical protein
VAGDLAAPDGLTRHPTLGRLLVTEEDHGRVLMMGPPGRTVVIDDRTPVYKPDGSRGPALRAPEGLCARSDGAVYVAEDYPGGRILCFRIGEDGRADFGRQVDVPGKLADFAWEAVACSADGRLLVAGSNAEAFAAGEDGPAMFMSILLYRDEKMNWWRVLGEPGVSLSSVVFSPDGRHAVYACEIHGFVGWLDLGDKEVRQRIGDTLMSSPESVAWTHDGRVLVAEEKGTVAVLNEAGEVLSRLDLGHGQIETVVWDAPSRTAWVTCDGQGSLLEVTGEALRQTPLPVDPAKVRMRSPWSPRYVADECPSFLEPLFASALKAGEDRSRLKTDFRSLAWRVPMVAADLELVQQSESYIEDPFLSLSLVLLHPNHIASDAKGGAATVCAFTARCASGKVIRSETRDVKATLFAVAMAKSAGTWNTQLPVPVPAAVRVSGEGVASVHMNGLGKSPDFNIVLNPSQPADSYVLVTDPQGASSYYRLSEACVADPARHIVVSYSERLGRMWMDLGRARHDDSLDVDWRNVLRNQMISEPGGT